MGVKRVVRAAVFDFGNVLAPFSHLKACTGLAQFSDLGPSEIYKAIFDDGINKRFDEGKLRAKKFYEEVSRKIDVNTKLGFGPFSDAWNSIFDHNPDMEPFLSEVRPDVKLFLLSNTNEIHWSYISELPVIQRFFSKRKQQVLSFRTRVIKPHPLAFLKVIARTGCERDGILYVDDIHANVKAWEALAGRGQGFVYHCELHSIDRLKVKFGSLGLLK